MVLEFLGRYRYHLAVTPNIDRQVLADVLLYNP
jgi:hypothetical protein